MPNEENSDQLVNTQLLLWRLYQDIPRHFNKRGNNHIHQILHRYFSYSTGKVLLPLREGTENGLSFRNSQTKSVTKSQSIRGEASSMGLEVIEQ